MKKVQSLILFIIERIEKKNWFRFNDQLFCITAKFLNFFAESIFIYIFDNQMVLLYVLYFLHILV